MAEEKLKFQAEVARLLHIVANALYSEKQIFLRELISNASDACDRLRYEAITRPDLTADDPNFKVRIDANRSKRTIEIADNGIGMNRETLISDLGTIARSGTSAFVEQLSGDAKKDMSLIGQFGVGFYSAFMVAEKVEVLTRRASEAQAWHWTSDGTGEFTVAEAEKPGRGTTITLHLRQGEDDFLEPLRLRQIIKTYSDHIALPIVLKWSDGKEETVNAASALWTRPRQDITADQYKEFYHHVGHSFDEPWMTLHWRAEGTIEFTNLLFIPAAKPFDLFHPDRRHSVRLYVKRVFITDKCEDLVPHWLRFLKGVVDCEDLPLNISREMLQKNPVVGRMNGAIVKRVLGDLAKKAEGEPAEYEKFWGNFGAVLKEGIYEDRDNRDPLLKLARFRSTTGEGFASLADYVGRMKPQQKSIYYISGEEPATLRKSPQLEGFAARGIEVLLLTDPVDEFWIPSVGDFEGKPFKSATRAGAELSDIPLASEKDAGPAPADAGKVDGLIALLKLTLRDAIKDVRVTERLTDTAVCLVSDEGDMDIRLERMLKQHRQIDESIKRILEINPRHQLIKALADLVGAESASARLTDAAWLLLDQARILEGEQLPDPAAFSRRFSEAMARGFAGAG
jgi:molecular chaperone HtpG